MLLMVSNLVAIAAFVGPHSILAKQVCGSLGLYHLAPLLRAYARWRTERAESNASLGGPLLHMLAHATALLALEVAFML